MSSLRTLEVTCAALLEVPKTNDAFLVILRTLMIAIGQGKRTCRILNLNGHYDLLHVLDRLILGVDLLLVKMQLLLSSS